MGPPLRYESVGPGPRRHRGCRSCRHAIDQRRLVPVLAASAAASARWRWL